MDKVNPTVVPFPARPELTPDERRSLRCLVGMVIPASQTYQVPGADDDRIFRDIETSLGRDADGVRAALARLDALGKGVFGDLTPAARDAAVKAFREQSPALATVIEEVTVRCYYRDDRVMQSIGMEPRPPFPKGFEVEPGDLSLLDPVRARPPIWREVP